MAASYPSQWWTESPTSFTNICKFLFDLKGPRSVGCRRAGTTLGAKRAPQVAAATDPFGLVSDLDASPRDAALDYLLDFHDALMGITVPGVPVLVFVPGWDPVAVADDFVARWIPAPGAPAGFAPTHVLIDPVGADPFHDEVVQIDAVVAFIPEPSSVVLGGLGLAAVALVALRRRFGR
jgi:hypothetical protein